MRRALLCAVAGVATVAAAGALAATGEREQHHFTAADQKAARTAVTAVASAPTESARSRDQTTS